MAKNRYHQLSVSTFRMCLCYLIVFIGFCSAANDNALFYYDTDSIHTRIEHSIHIELLDKENSHNPRKRDVELESPLTVTSSTTAAVASVVQKNKSEKVVPWKSQTKLTSPINLSDKQYSILGANGTGQRRNISQPREPPSLLHNIGPSVNTPVKSITETTVSVEDEATIYPGKLTPEEVEVGGEIDKKDLAENNITDFKTDNHIFYNSTTYNDPTTGKQLWVDLENRSDVKINDLLSTSHRRAATVKLSFEFPYYGRYIKNVTIATGGFLYTGNFVHSWLAATQYIAPLMANFDTGLSNDSIVKYVDNGTAFTVEWHRVALQDKPSQEFTFQTTLHKNGNIVFVYKNIPLSINDINDQLHPVKVGLSDAYILDQTIFYVRRKSIYEYHRVTFNKQEIRNWTAIYLTALPTCLDLLNCTSCTYNVLNMNCTWCPSLNQCSTGQDRNRQFWIDKGCELKNITSESSCLDDEKLNNSLNYEVEEASKLMDDDYIGRLPRQTNNRLGASGYVAVIFLIAMVVGIGLWGAYAYKNPHTTSGQILIRNTRLWFVVNFSEIWDIIITIQLIIMTESGFSKAQSNNLPRLYQFMIARFFANNELFSSAEIRGVKLDRDSRDSYGDSAIGYVQVKREESICIVKEEICPEHRLNVTLEIDGNAEEFQSCHDCAAALVSTQSMEMDTR